MRHASNRGLPFPPFYRLMRALYGGSTLLRPTHPSGSVALPEACSESSCLRDVWPKSEFLRRLVFALLADTVEPWTELGAAERNRVDEAGLPLSASDILGSLRALLCVPVLLAVDVRGGSPSGEANACGGAAALGNPGTQLRALAEFLHAQMVQSSRGESSSNDGSVCPIAPSFRAFEHFVWRQPSFFCGLLLLLMPLAERGAEFIADELQLSGKRTSLHRAGEIRAKMNSLTQQLQGRQMEVLHHSFLLPWLGATQNGDCSLHSSPG